MMEIRKQCFSLCLLFALSPLAATSAAEYTVTEEQLTGLETVFSELRTQQQAQEKLLTTQRTQIEELKKQQKGSQTQIENSRKLLTETETRLAEANKYLTQYESSVKKTEKRLERQRDTWAVFAAITVGMMIARR